ncbi:MarP family serine protease [Motilibacter aurantiacus]|uniref:MarP family serine protease n=1 Tax=Motilibacter aurantiacus TaxID=2714955 RepID=UPI0014098E00|nr:MarP family serine protease [Motilibacter aurantiacus]
MILDIALVVAIVSFALSGFRQGFLVAVLGFVGFLGGGVAAMVFTPRVVGDWSPGPGQVLAAASVVVVAAVLGQLLLTGVGGRLRRLLVWGPARLVDSALGALLSVLGLLVVTWFLGTAVRGAELPRLSKAVGESHVLRAVDSAMPDTSQHFFSSFRTLLDDGSFPQVFGGLAPERILPVEPPDAGVVQTRGIAAARRSIVQVSGSSKDCDRRIEGSGFVYAQHHVLTNAHVVAGVTQPTVQVGGVGEVYKARVVAFDFTRDVAVLYVPDLEAKALPLVDGAGRGDSGVVAGFPRGGPFRLDAARVREVIQARGPNIYNTRTVSREVLSLYARIQPGNSGGPLLSPSGGVIGMVFAKSVDDAETGYALTVAELSPVADGARAATKAVDTRACAA